MRKAMHSISELLDKLEQFYGKQEPSWPVDPYEFIVWWQCGYPASDAACTKGWDKLKSEIGIEPHNLLSATPNKLALALKAGGMVPELRALRLKEIAMRVKDEFSGDLRAALVGPLPNVRKTLKKFPCIADPGADRILLFAGIVPIAAVPSNCPQVLFRILYGREGDNYGVTYRRRTAGYRGRDTANLLRARPRLSAVKKAWTGNLQTYQAEVQRMSHKIELPLLR